MRDWSDKELEERASELNREIERMEGEEGTGEDAIEERNVLAAVSRELLIRRGEEKRRPSEGSRRRGGRRRARDQDARKASLLKSASEGGQDVPAHLTLLTVERDAAGARAPSFLALEFDEDLFREIRGLEAKEGYGVPRNYAFGRYNVQTSPAGGPLKLMLVSRLFEIRSGPEMTAAGSVRNRAAWAYLGMLEVGAEAALYWR